jgi:hypothetical protein
VYKAHLAPKGLPTAFIKISGGSASTVAIQKLMARICPFSSQWKWEAIPHGDDAYFVSFPTTNDLKRVDGFQMGVPDSSAQMSVSIWKAQDVPHKFELQPIWVHVDGVPHTVRHFLGLWVVGSLIGTTLDVDLVSLRSRGVVRILVAMNEPKNLDKQNDILGYACLGVSVTVQLKGDDFFFHREPVDFVQDEGFTPFFWKHKGDDDAGFDGSGLDNPQNDAPNRDSSSTSASMDVDKPQGEIPCRMASLFRRVRWWVLWLLCLQLRQLIPIQLRRAGKKSWRPCACLQVFWQMFLLSVIGCNGLLRRRLCRCLVRRTWASLPLWPTATWTVCLRGMACRTPSHGRHLFPHRSDRLVAGMLTCGRRHP